MIRVEYSGKGWPRFAVADGMDETRAAANAIGHIPGVRVSGRAVLFPMETRLLELLLEKTSLVASEEVRAWHGEQVEKESARARLAGLQDVKLPHEKASALWDFQRVGANFIRHLGKSLLCDDPGTGKTATTIVGAELARWHRKMLVICPNSLKQWWASEIEQWSAYDYPICVLESRRRDAQMASFDEGWLIVNYELVFRTPQLGKRFWDWIVCDEAHRLKNRQTKTWDAVSKLRSRRVALLTGTPYGNDPAELWALLHLLDKDRYPSYWRFFEMFVEYWEDHFGGRKILGVRNPEILRRELAPIMIRRHKEEVLPSLPDKLYQTIPLAMGRAQAAMYRKAAKEMLIELGDGEDIEIPNAVAKITRLRQILSSPNVFNERVASCKGDAALDLVKDTNEKLVVFTQFRATVEELCRRLTKEDVGHVGVMGGVDVGAAVQRFQNDPACRVFVATADTGGVGLTLTASRRIVFLEHHWNPVRQMQAEDRVHRIGQERKVHIVSLMCPKTVDDLVEKILQRKLAMIGAVLGRALIESLKGWA